ncbi:TPA: hypothetical protein MH639_20675 [Klebsiella pneumoniae]|nr:hypothetical protein [Klebsiella pneumoniae]
MEISKLVNSLKWVSSRKLKCTFQTCSKQHEKAMHYGRRRILQGLWATLLLKF